MTRSPVHRRRSPALVALVALAVLIGACGDETADPPPDPTPELDRASLMDRAVGVCERAGAAGVVERCDELAASAVDGAVAAGCDERTVDAVLEHGVAWRFQQLPPAELFDRCPAPLSSLVLVTPEGVDVGATDDARVGLLTTPEVAARFVDPDGVSSYLEELGHQVSYARRWDLDHLRVEVRLDRFATTEAATHWSTPAEPDEMTTSTTVAGVAQGRLEHRGPPGATEVVASGRVCEVAITVVSTVDSGDADVDLPLTWLQAQASRLAAGSRC